MMWIFSGFGGLSSQAARVLEQFAVFSRKDDPEFDALLKSIQDISSIRAPPHRLNVNDCANAFGEQPFAGLSYNFRQTFNLSLMQNHARATQVFIAFMTSPTCVMRVCEFS